MDCVNRPKIRGLMAEKGYTITTLAQATGLSRDGLSRFLRGHSPGYRMMKSIAKELGLTSEEAGRIFFDHDLRDA